MMEELTSDALQDVPLPVAAEGCRNYRNYIDRHYGAGNPEGHLSYLLTREDLKSLIDGGLGRLDGIRIYIGHTGRAEQPLVRLYVVGVRKKGPRHDDELPRPPQGAEGKSGEGQSTLAAARLVTGRPCPSQCSSSNILNS